MKIPGIVLCDGDDREIWSGSLHDFGRRNGTEVVREVIAQFRASLKVNGRLEPAFIGGGAAPHFMVLLVAPAGDPEHA